MLGSQQQQRDRYNPLYGFRSSSNNNNNNTSNNRPKSKDPKKDENLSQWSKVEIYSSKHLYAGISIDPSNNIYFAKQRGDNSYIKKILRLQVSKPIVAHIISEFGKQQNQVIPREIIKHILSYCSDFDIFETHKYQNKIYCIAAGTNGVVYLGGSNGIVRITSKGAIDEIDLEMRLQFITRSTQSGDIYFTDGKYIKKMSGREAFHVKYNIEKYHNYAGIAIDAFQNIYVAVPLKGRVQKISPSGEIFNFDRFVGPTYLASDDYGNIYVAEQRDGSIFMISPEGVVSTIATMKNSFIFGMAVNNDGSIIYVVNTGRIWKIEKKKGNELVGTSASVPLSVYDPVFNF